MGHSKTAIDKEAKVHYRRCLDYPLEETNVKTEFTDDSNDLEHIIYKSPFDQREIKILHQFKIDEDYKNILKEKISRSVKDDVFYFLSPFKKEHLIRGKSNKDKKKTFIFDSMKDPMKYIFIHKDDAMKPIEFDQIHKKDTSQLDNKREAEKLKRQLSKGEFIYLIRIFNPEIFKRNLKILEGLDRMKNDRKIVKRKNKFFIKKSFQKKNKG